MTGARTLKINRIIYKDTSFSLEFLPLNEKDAEVICSAIPFSLKDLQPFMEWSHHDLSLENQIARIKESQKNFSLGNGYDFSVFAQASRDFMMSASLNAPRSPNKKSLGIGYWTSSI